MEKKIESFIAIIESNCDGTKKFAEQETACCSER